jgi:peptide deformylase
VEGDELLGRVFQHELDHLDGVLLLERLDTEQRKEARRTLRERALGLTPPPRADHTGAL